MVVHTSPRAEDVDDDFEDIYFENIDYQVGDEFEINDVNLEELEEQLEHAIDHSSDSENGDNLLLPSQDDSIITFQQHFAPVFACAMHPYKDLCVTGGEDDKVYVWHRINGNIIQEINNHGDSIIEVHFNHDGMYLATGDMAGVIVLHKLQESSGNESTENESNITVRKVWEYIMGDMSWMQWHKAANVLIAGSESGEIYVFRLPAGECKVLPGEGVRCESGEFTGDGKQLLASYNSGCVKLWDIKMATVLMEINSQCPVSHQEGASTVACSKHSHLFMSGDENGTIIFSTPNGPVGMVEVNGSVECLAFSPSSDFKMAASGTLHGQISVWDYSKLSMRVECDHENVGITKIQWISDFTFLVSTLQGNILAFDARTGQQKFALYGHMGEIHSFYYDPKERLILTVSEDNFCKIFKVPECD